MKKKLTAYTITDIAMAQALYKSETILLLRLNSDLLGLMGPNDVVGVATELSAILGLGSDEVRSFVLAKYLVVKIDPANTEQVENAFITIDYFRQEKWQGLMLALYLNKGEVEESSLDDKENDDDGEPLGQVVAFPTKKPTKFLKPTAKQSLPEVQLFNTNLNEKGLMTEIAYIETESLQINFHIPMDTQIATKGDFFVAKCETLNQEASARQTDDAEEKLLEKVAWLFHKIFLKDTPLSTDEENQKRYLLNFCTVQRKEA